MTLRTLFSVFDSSTKWESLVAVSKADSRKRKMGNCCGDIAGGRQAVGEAPSKGVIDGRLEIMEAVEKVTGLHGYVTQVELSFSAMKLRNKDILSKSDPMLVVYTKKRDGLLEEVGRTEVILNSLNPKWITEVTMMYSFEELQPLV